jgi:CHRD domain
MNRFVLIIVGLCVFAGGCSESLPTEPSEETRTTTTFTVNLSPVNEVPPVANADAGASGTATIALTVTRDASSNITSATADFQIAVTGFPTGTVVTDAHVHNAPAGGNGGIFINTALTSGELAITNGSGSITKNGINVPADRAAAILNTPAGHYFNVHTALNPDGAIRGQLSAGTTGPAY